MRRHRWKYSLEYPNRFHQCVICTCIKPIVLDSKDRGCCDLSFDEQVAVQEWINLHNLH